MVSLLMFVWLRRGEDHARGARAGLLAGLAPLAMPPAAQAYALWQPATAAVVPAGCLLGGLLGGVVLAVLGTRAARASRDFWIAALTVCLAAGAGGCLFAGLLGLTGMALGLGLGAAPLLAARRA
jgi:hypothetical protein